MLLAVIVVVALAASALYLYAYINTRWTLESLPSVPLEINEGEDYLLVQRDGKTERLMIAITFDYYDHMNRRCLIAGTTEELHRRHAYVFTRPLHASGPYSYELNDTLRNTAQDCIVEALSNRH